MNDKTPQQYWNDKFAATEDLVYTEAVNRFVKELSEGLKPGKMIDLAGGEGRNAVYFAELGWQAENIDISNVGLTKFLKFAEERGVSEKVFANCADATGFESVLTPVDLGVVAYLQIEVNDLADALDCLIENIRKGGVLFGVWHSRANLGSDYSGQQNPDLLADIDEIREIMADQPVEIEVLENLEGQIQTKDGLKPSITLVLKAKKL
jgi:SAM-dependent methyltransferase